MNKGSIDTDFLIGWGKGRLPLLLFLYCVIHGVYLRSGGFERIWLLSPSFQTLGILGAADPDSFLETNTGLIAQDFPRFLAGAISD